jgi:quinol monooxygenase YgiN
VNVLVERVRQEPGCASSEFYRDAEKKNAQCVLEQWATEADLGAHLKSDNFSVFRGALKVLAVQTETKFHTVSQTRGKRDVFGRVRANSSE